MTRCRRAFAVSAVLFALCDLVPVLGQGLRGNRVFNPYDVQFKQLWDAPLQDPVKLIEVAPVTGDGKDRLIMVVDSGQPNDYRRNLVVSHWDGFRFQPDYTVGFVGAKIDALLAGHFRTPPVGSQGIATPATRKGHRGKPAPVEQIVDTEGIYEWNGHTFTRIFGAPESVRLEIVRDGAANQLVAGDADQAAGYEVGPTDAHACDVSLAPTAAGYVRFGIGTQQIAGAPSMDIAPGVRYAQSYWDDRYKWVIGVMRDVQAGSISTSSDSPGERIVVYTPTYRSREKMFWAIDKEHFLDDLAESWRSPLIPGHILDVRVGDPKQEGTLGILVLTVEPKGNQRHLYFFGVAPTTPGVP